MNVLKNNSFEIRDFIYLINKVLKKGHGVDTVSERLYKPIKNKESAEPKKLKRPALLDRKPKKSENKLVKNEKKEPQPQPDVLLSINTIQSETLKEKLKSPIEKQGQEIPIVAGNKLMIMPKTYFQTMAWSMQQLKVFDKLRDVVQLQVNFYRKQLQAIAELQQYKQVISMSKQNISNQVDERLRAWELVKAKKQRDLLVTRVEEVLHHIGFVPNVAQQEYTGDMITILQQQLDLLLQKLEDSKYICKFKFLGKQSTSQLIEVLVQFESIYQHTNSIDEIIITKCRYPDYLVTLFKESQKMVTDVEQQYGQIDTIYQQQCVRELVVRQLLSMNFIQQVSDLLNGTLKPNSQFSKQIQNWFIQLDQLKCKVMNHQDYSEFLEKLVLLREKQLYNLIHILRLLESQAEFRVPRIIRLYYIKEVKLFQKYPTNFPHLTELAKAFQYLQGLLAKQQLFISNLTQEKVKQQFLNHEMEVVHIAQTQMFEIQAPAVDAVAVQLELIQQIQQQNRFIKAFQEGVPRKEMLQGEYLNKWDRELSKLTMPKQEQQKTRTAEKLQVNVLKPQKMKHQDLIGQMIWIIEDIKYEMLVKDLNNYCEQIDKNYNVCMHNNGIFKIMNLSILESQLAILQSITLKITQIMIDYQQDPTLQDYLKLDTSKWDFVVNKLKQVDFQHFAIHLARTAINIRLYYQQFDIGWVLSRYPLPQIQLYQSSIKYFLIQGQKIFEQSYEQMLKGLLELIDQQWKSSLSLKIISSSAKRNKLVKLYQNLAQAYLLKYEGSRLLFYKWAKHFYYIQKNVNKPQYGVVTPYLEKSVSSKIQKLLVVLLGTKLKYFPGLHQEIMDNLSPIQKVIQDRLGDCLNIYLIQMIEYRNNNKQFYHYKKAIIGQFNQAVLKNEQSILEDCLNIMDFIIKKSVYFNLEQLQLLEIIQGEIRLDKQCSNKLQLLQQAQQLVNLINNLQVQPELKRTAQAFSIQIEFETIVGQQITIVTHDPPHEERINADNGSTIYQLKTNEKNTIVQIKPTSIIPKVIAVYIKNVMKSIVLSINQKQEIIHPTEHNPLKFKLFQVLVYDAVQQIYTTNKYVKQMIDF